MRIDHVVRGGMPGGRAGDPIRFRRRLRNAGQKSSKSLGNAPTPRPSLRSRPICRPRQGSPLSAERTPPSRSLSLHEVNGRVGFATAVN